MAVISMKQLLEAGVHFGRKLVAGTLRWLGYIFTERNGDPRNRLATNCKICRPSIRLHA